MINQVKHKGFIATQARNNHVIICKDGKKIAYFSFDKPLSKEELVAQVEFIIRRGAA